jgi:hypothetical protein
MILLSSIFLLQVEGLLKDVALFSSTIDQLNNLSIPNLDLFVKLICETLFKSFKFCCLEISVKTFFINLCHRLLDENVIRSKYVLKWFHLFDFVGDFFLFQRLAVMIRASDRIENGLLKSLAENEKFMNKSKFAFIRNLLFRSVPRSRVPTRSSRRRTL